MTRFIHQILLIFVLILFAGSATAFASGDDSKDYEALLDSTDNYIKRERWDDAARCIRKSLAMKPGSPLNWQLFKNLGICLTNTGNYNEALEAFELALVRQPESPSILSSRAVTYMLANQPAEAKKDLDIVVAKDTLDSRSLRLHGQLSLIENDLETARRDFHRLSAISPEDPWGPAGLAECFVEENDYPAAIPLFEEAVRLEDNTDFRISLISALLEANRLADAENAIREAIALYPRVGEFYLLRGVLHKTLYQNSDAEIDKKLAIEYGADPQTVEKYLSTKRK